MQRRFRQAYTSLKEHTCVTYAKITTIAGFCDLDNVLIKTTTPDDLPLPEKYIQELLKIFSISPTSGRAFLLSFTRRFGKTRCWRVALKCLVLLHRLLRLLPLTSPFRSDLLWARTNGLISLYPCHFRDCSSSAPEDFTIFVRSYARLLDKALLCYSYGGKFEGGSSELPESLSEMMKEVGRILEVLPQLQNLIDRVMDCKPAGAAAKSFIVRLAMKQIVRDSFICYTGVRRDIVVVLDNLFQLQHRSSVSAFGIYKKAAIQATQLSMFYESCKSMGLCGTYEYPIIDKIPQIHVRALESFLDGVWRLTETSSSVTSPSSSTADSPSTLTEEEGDRQLARLKTVISTKWEKFEEEEEEPLIRLEVDNNVSWEALLETSVTLSRASANYLLVCPPTNEYGYGNGFGCGYRYGNRLEDKHEDETKDWKLQVYNPNASNPFYHTYNSPNYYEACTSNHMYPWGL